MNTKLLCAMSIVMLICLMGCGGSSKVALRENGWYLIRSGQKDSIPQEPVVAVKDFTALQLETDGMGHTAITGTISPYKCNKWAETTERNIGNRICFIFNGEIITAPKVSMRMESGNFRISNPYGHDLEKLYESIRQEKIDSIEALFAGWEKDYVFSKEKADSLRFAMDYHVAAEWMDMSANPDDHYWWGELDIVAYKELEDALRQELDKPNFSSRAEDYMKSDAYKAYKAYLCEHPDYINLMFQSFLFTEPSAGLCGWLVDDIVQTRYPEAPCLRQMVAGTDNRDDECFAKLKYQKAVWRLMNREQGRLRGE